MILAVRPGPQVIGLAGGTAAGKTTLARLLAAKLGDVAHLAIDAYYRELAGLSTAERAAVNFDDPSAIEIELLLSHLDRLCAGLRIERPVYSFSEHTRVGLEPVEPARIILVEGLWTLWWAELRSRLTLGVYLDSPSDLRLARRLARDVAERGRAAAAVARQFAETVHPMHERYVAPTAAHAHLVVTSAMTGAEAVQSILDALAAGHAIRD